ncbi:MAG: hypothetical protein P8Y75_11915 [Nitrospirota bacterium]|jgi:hypothetical protein
MSESETQDNVNTEKLYKGLGEAMGARSLVTLCHKYVLYVERANKDDLITPLEVSLDFLNKAIENLDRGLAGEGAAEEGAVEEGPVEGPRQRVITEKESKALRTVAGILETLYYALDAEDYTPERVVIRDMVYNALEVLAGANLIWPRQEGGTEGHRGEQRIP